MKYVIVHRDSTELYTWQVFDSKKLANLYIKYNTIACNAVKVIPIQYTF